MWQTREVVAECGRLQFNAAVGILCNQMLLILGDTSCAKRMLCWSVEREFYVSGLAVDGLLKSTHSTQFNVKALLPYRTWRSKKYYVLKLGV